MKKRFLVLIAICVLFASLSVSVMAEDAMPNETLIEEPIIEDVTFEENITEDNIIEDASLETVPEISSFSMRYSNEQKASILRDFLVERLSNIEQYQDELSLGEYLFVSLSELSEFELLADSNNIASTRKIISMAINDIQNKFPKLFWVKNDWYYEWNTPSYKVTKIGLKLDCDTAFDINDGLQPVIDTVNSLIAEFDNYVHSIVDLIPNSYSDYEKILFVNDYLCTNYRYDVNYTVYNPYDFFKKGTGVCQGYTLAFMAIMEELGIRCDTVVSEEMNHIWNLVELNGKWYHIDVTWNDPYWENCNTDTLGLAEHKYFLLSSDRMQDSAHNHTGFDVESYGYEIGTEYNNVEVDLTQSLRSSFINLNGVWYNTGYNTNTRTCGLYAFASPNISSITNNDLEAPLHNIGYWAYAGSFSYLSKYKDTILFNTPTSICVFDGNNVAELYIPEKEDDESIYGFTVKENVIYIQLATNPNKDGIKNATLKTANLIDVVYKDYDGTILSEGFAVEGAETPNLFMPETPARNTSAYYDYTFVKWATEDGCTFVAQYKKTLKEGITLPGQEGITISSMPNDKVYGDEGFKITVSTTEETPDLGSFEFSIVDQEGKVDNASEIATIDEEGNVTIKAAGTAYIKVSRDGGDNYADFNQIYPLVVEPKEIIVTPTSGLYKYEGQKDVELTYTYEDDKIIDVENDVISGTLSRVAGEEPGFYNITLGTLKINDNYKLVLSEAAVTFEIKAKLNQDVTVSETDNTNVYYGDTLTFTVEQTTPDVTNAFVFSSNNEKVATVDEDGKVTFVGVGEVKITISNVGNDKYNNYEKVFTFNVSKREITLSAINFDEKTVTFTNNLETDTNINLDFNKAIFEVMSVCEEDDTKSNVKVTNLILSGERAEFYTLITEQINCTVANTNVIDVNPKAENGSISGIGKYLANVEVTLTATANSDYNFDGWYNNETLISTNATYTFNTSELEGIEAKFSKKPVNAGGGGAGGGGGGGAATKPSTNDDKTEDMSKTENIEEEEKGSSEEITPVEWSNPFNDVDENAWYYTDVKNIITNNLMTGTADNTFSPDTATTRGMIVTILYRLEGEPIIDNNNVFTDVNGSDYYAKAVAWAVANGIVNGVEEGKFAPNDEITREQFAAILYRYANFKKLDVVAKAELDNFSDNEDISTWATEAIAWANTNGIITGTSATTISPQNVAVRAQTAAMLNRFINLQENS